MQMGGSTGMVSKFKMRCILLSALLIPNLFLSKLAFAQCLPGTEITDRVVPDFWAGERINVQRDDVTQIYASRATMCGSLLHINHDGQITGRGTTQVFGWNDTTEDRLIFTINVPTMEAGAYRVRLVVANNGVGAGNVFEISALETSTSGTVEAEPSSASLREIGVDYNRIEMDGLLNFKPGTNNVQVKLSQVSNGQIAFAENNSTQNNSGLKLFAIELIEEADYQEIRSSASEPPGDYDWYTEEGRYGIMVHFSARFTRTHSAGSHISGAGTYPAGFTIRNRWSEFINDFNVEEFADRIDTMGGDYVVMTIFHGRAYLPAPSEVLDSIIPGRTAERDLIKDLGNELESRGKRLLLYFHPATADADWIEAAGIFNLENLQEFNNNIIDLHEEMANRYNGTGGFPTLGSTAIYLDAGYQGTFQRQFPYRRFIETIKAPGALPNAVIGLSYQHVVAPTQFSDVIKQDNGEGLPVFDPFDFENRTGSDAPLATRGTRIAGVAKQQASWPTFPAPTGWNHPSHEFDHEDSAIEAYVHFITGRDGMVYFNSIIAGDVREGVPFLQPAAVEQMDNVRKAIARSLSQDIVDNSRFWDLNFSSDWEHEHSEHAYAATISRSEAAGASIEMEFEGQEVAVYATTTANGGDVDVFIDGQLVDTVSTQSSTTQTQVKVFEMTGLTATDHTIRLEAVSNAAVALDYIQSGKTEPAIDAQTIVTDNSDTYEIDYSGGWSHLNRANSINGTISTATTEGASAEFLFFGNGIEVFTQRGPNAGVLRFFIDDQLVATRNGFSENVIHGDRVFGTASLSTAPHKLRVECGGQSPSVPSGSDFNCHIDAIRAINNNSDRATIDDDDDLVLNYSGNWTHESRSNAFGNTISYTNQKNAEVELTFTGTGVQVITQSGPSAGIMDFYLNGKKMHTVDTYLPNGQPQRGVFYPQGLADATHNLRVVCTGDRNDNSNGNFCHIDRIIVD